MICHVLGYCGGAYLADKACPGYLVEWEEGSILLDMGSGVLGKLDEINRINEIKNIYISHFHYDHYGDLGVMIHHRLINRVLGKTKEMLNIYCPPEEPFFSLYNEENVAMTIPVLGEELTIEGARLNFWETNHSKLCYACRIEYGGKRLVYTADTGYSEELVSFAKNAELLITECSIPSRFPKQDGHMRPDQVSELVRKSKAQQVLVTHLPFYERIVKDEFFADVPLFMAKNHLALQI